MVTIKFFGLLRSNHSIQSLHLDVRHMSEIIDYLNKHYPRISKQELEDAALFINQQKVMHMKRFDIPLNDGDEVVFTTYVGGG